MKKIGIFLALLFVVCIAGNVHACYISPVATLPLYSDKTANYSITTNECRGTTFTNTGDVDANRGDLPNITAIGQRVCFLLTVAQDMDVNPDDSGKILVLTSDAGDAVSSDAIIGSKLCLEAVSLTQWFPTYVGVWTDAN